MNRAATWFAATCIAIAMAAAGNLDGPDDHEAEWAQSTELQALQDSQAGTARREAAAQALCSKERGPNSEARWTADGDLVCTTRRGLVKVAGVQP